MGNYLCIIVETFSLGVELGRGVVDSGIVEWLVGSWGWWWWFVWGGGRRARVLLFKKSSPVNVARSKLIPV